MPEIKNYMEDCVLDLIDPVLDDLGMCKCEKCRYDVLAIVLNNVRPKYVVTRKGGMYTKLAALQSQFNVDILTEIAKAAEVVRDNPRHEESD